MTNVPEMPKYGSVDSYEQMMRKTKGNVYPFAIGVIESIATDLHDTDAEKVRRICNALIACGRVAGIALDHFGEPAPVPSGAVADRRSCVDPGEQEHDHEMCRDAVAEPDVEYARKVARAGDAWVHGGPATIDPDSSMEAHYDAETDAGVFSPARRQELFWKRAVAWSGSVEAALDAAHAEALREDNCRATAIVAASMTREDEGRIANPRIARFLAERENERRAQPPGGEPVVRYFSFGHGHTDPDTGADLVDRYVTVVAPTAEACREAMFASRYGKRWSFEYIPGTPQADEWIPRWNEHERIDAMPASAE